jgi:hypothetical protein
MLNSDKNVIFTFIPETELTHLECYSSTNKCIAVPGEGVNLNGCTVAGQSCGTKPPIEGDNTIYYIAGGLVLLAFILNKKKNKR